MRLGGDDSDVPVPIIQQVLCDPAALGAIVHRYMRKARAVRIFADGTDGTEDEGDRQAVHDAFRMRVIVPEKNDALGLFLYDDLLRHSEFVLRVADVLQDHGVVITPKPRVNQSDQLGKERVGHALDEDRHRIGTGPLKVARAVVRDIIVFFYCLVDLRKRLRIDVRMMIEGPRYRTDADAADAGDIFYRNFHNTASAGNIFPKLPRISP